MVLAAALLAPIVQNKHTLWVVFYVAAAAAVAAAEAASRPPVVYKARPFPPPAHMLMLAHVLTPAQLASSKGSRSPSSERLDKQPVWEHRLRQIESIT